MEKAGREDGSLRTKLFEPFEILRHSNRENSRKENENAGSGRDLEIWLPTLDTFRTFLSDPSLDLGSLSRLVAIDSPISAEHIYE